MRDFDTNRLFDPGEEEEEQEEEEKEEEGRHCLILRNVFLGLSFQWNDTGFFDTKRSDLLKSIALRPKTSEFLVICNFS